MAFGSYKNLTPQSEEVQQTTQRQISQTPQQKMQPVAPASNSLSPDNLLQLQRTVGNRTVQRLLGESATPQESFSAFQQRVNVPVQAKLTVTPANDKYETEADSMANQVMQTMRANPVQRMDEDEMMMQRMGDEEEMMMQRDFSNGGAVGNNVESQIMSARGGGQGLADNVRAPMENAFNADFSNVRVHTDSQSDTLNRSVQARAFTTGSDIFFRSGEYSPSSNSGQRLLAHELTHVVQQGASGQRKADDQ